MNEYFIKIFERVTSFSSAYFTRLQSEKHKWKYRLNAWTIFLMFKSIFKKQCKRTKMTEWQCFLCHMDSHTFSLFLLKLHKRNHCSSLLLFFQSTKTIIRSMDAILIINCIKVQAKLVLGSNKNLLPYKNNLNVDCFWISLDYYFLSFLPSYCCLRNKPMIGILAKSTFFLFFLVPII